MNVRQIIILFAAWSVLQCGPAPVTASPLRVQQPGSLTLSYPIGEGRERVKQPNLCQDGTKQYSGYVPGSPLFFWFFESRSNPSGDPIGLWVNGGPGSSSLLGMDFLGPCQIVGRNVSGSACGKEEPYMQVREWSWNRNSSILMVDNPRSVGFSTYPFPASHSIYDGAVDLYNFLQSFMKTFPEYSSHEMAFNSLSYGGHYAPAYAGYILHRNALLSGEESLYSDVWPDDLVSNDRNTSTDRLINLESVSIGNGWMNPSTQMKSNVDFACGHPDVQAEGIPILGDKGDCDWAYQRWEACVPMLEECQGQMGSPRCASAGLWCGEATNFPYMHGGYNPYDYRTKVYYSEGLPTMFYNSRSTQIELGVISEKDNETVTWVPHVEAIQLEYQISGDSNKRTDYLMERMMRAGINVLKYEGMVDWICNFLGVREVIANLPGYQHQSAFNKAEMTPWSPLGEHAGAYKCFQAPPGAPKGERGSSVKEGKLCYLEILGAGHIVALDKPQESAWMIANWLHNKALA